MIINDNRPKNRDVRYIKRFLFLPLTIADTTKWLESVIIRQIYYEDEDFLGLSVLANFSGWYNTDFINKRKWEEVKNEYKYNTNDRVHN